MKETIIFMVLVCIGSGGAFLVWKKTGNYDVDYLIISHLCIQNRTSVAGQGGQCNFHNPANPLQD